MAASNYPRHMAHDEDKGPDWIDQLTDSQCMEVFWLYLEAPDEFLDRHPPALLGRAMRKALREVVTWTALPGGDAMTTGGSETP